MSLTMALCNIFQILWAMPLWLNQVNLCPLNPKSICLQASVTDINSKLFFILEGTPPMFYYLVVITLKSLTLHNGLSLPLSCWSNLSHKCLLRWSLHIASDMLFILLTDDTFNIFIPEKNTIFPLQFITSFSIANNILNF